MALINIVKGMAGGAEAIQANFAAIGEMTTGTNANGTYTRWPNGFTIAQKKIAFRDEAGYTGGKWFTFSIGTLPIAFISGTPIVTAKFYDGKSGFDAYKLNITMVTDTAGTVFIDRGMSTAKDLYMDITMIGMS